MNEQIKVLTFEKGQFVPGIIMANMLKIGNNWLPRTGPPMVNQDGSLGANFGYSSSQTYVKLMPAQELHPVHEPWSMDKIRKAHEVELQELA